MLDEDTARAVAIQHVLDLQQRWTVVPASELAAITSQGHSIHLKGPQGIFKPAAFSRPLSITSTLRSPYNDDPIAGAQVFYDFAPAAREYENELLKRCCDERVQLIYFVQVKPKPLPEYLVFAPVLVVAADRETRRFLIDLTGGQALVGAQMMIAQPATLSKRYTPTVVQRRLHQAKFRNAILDAYRNRCAVCVLRIRPLLDAAHVTPDHDPTPTLIVQDGIALCATHHRAFDARILGYDANYTIRVELPHGLNAGEGEKRMLLSYDRARLMVPTQEHLRPRVLDEWR